MIFFLPRQRIVLMRRDEFGLCVVRSSGQATESWTIRASSGGVCQNSVFV